jgi:hypothetical protein
MLELRNYLTLTKLSSRLGFGPSGALAPLLLAERLSELEAQHLFALDLALQHNNNKYVMLFYVIISGSACSTVGVHSQAWSTSGIGRLGSKSGRG